MAHANRLKPPIPTDVYQFPPQHDLIQVFSLMVDMTTESVPGAKPEREIAWVRLDDDSHFLVHSPEADVNQAFLPNNTAELIAHTHPSTNVNLGNADRKTLTALSQRKTWIIAAEKGSKSKKNGAVLWEFDGDEKKLLGRAYF